MAKFRLPGISKIHYIDCASLQPGLMLKSICGCMVEVNATAKPIVLCAGTSAELEWENSKVNGKRRETSSLVFSTLLPLPEDKYLAFVVTCVDGRHFLIGTREANYPEVSYSETTGSTSRTAASRTYKIKHIAQKSVLPCVL